MTVIKDFIIKYKYQLFCLIVAFSMLLLTSKNSFFYTFNDWCDANAFFTVGKSIVHGIVPYRDLFEQKGPLLYLLYSLGYLISNKTFYGIFIIEILFFTVFLYYVHKLINFFLDEKYSFILLPIITLIITTSNAFVHGGSCEEYCFPLFGITLYYFLKNFLVNKLTKKEIIINGFIAGCILLTKFTLLGFWIGFVFIIFADYIKTKEIKKTFIFCIDFLLGMIIPIIITLLCFYAVGGLKDFINVYFIINITAYGPKKNDYLIELLLTWWYLLLKSGTVFYVSSILFPLFVCSIKTINKNIKIKIIGLFIITFFFIIISLKTITYYILTLSIFIPITVIGIVFLTKTNKIIIKNYLVITIYIICILLGATTANYKEYMFKPKSKIFQYKYADYINKYENPTLLNIKNLDMGVYTLTGIVPTTKYFEEQNINYERFPENVDEMNKYAENKEVKFIVMSFEKNKYEIPQSVIDNYELIYEDKYKYEFDEYYARLYKLKGLEK